MMEYFIVELTPKGDVPHGSTFNEVEAGSMAANIQLKNGNPVTVKAELISSNQIEDDEIGFFRYPMTAEELFTQSRINEETDYDLLPPELKRIYEACAAVGNKMIAALLHFTDNSEGLES